MSSVTTTLPVGPMPRWCSMAFDPNPDSFFHASGCANTTRGESPSDYITICCDGEIIDSQFDLWGSLVGNETRIYDLADMVCCRQAGRAPGGLLPIASDTTSCPSGTPTPLASMAATNTDNAQNFPVTWVSASELPGGGLGDWTTRSSPHCMWINTKKASRTTEAVLPAADITTLPPESSLDLRTSHDWYTFPATEPPSTALNATASSSGPVTESASLPSSTLAASQSRTPLSSSSAENAGSAMPALYHWPFLAVLLVAAVLGAA